MISTSEATNGSQTQQEPILYNQSANPDFATRQMSKSCREKIESYEP